ncbi:naringenin-chalcone synthase [Curtobacterium citreum]|uniref:Type III polyketide synthase n=1 Tax=Curtobacterium citreum TaxID=2036 RepID=A0ABT2HF58_9MICO|nr:type III polyketide synthase [Curtobacterium citreum]MCS6521890.1 type III polyketide synthase [Curtobacterium citreum]TQJ27282.1 putative naringenin-chalcone synthase [Curtobacterium citreum]GGL72626.1 naringenin-chalcone synthase [Curtobacterium citreum]
MTATIRAVGTAVPTTTLDQAAVRDLFAGQPDLGRLGRRLVPAAFDGSDVAHRHTVLEELDSARPGGTFRQDDGALVSPSTGTRNDRYRDLAPALFVAAARDAVERAGIEPARVTHLVTVSCTGFTQPGPDIDVVAQLGLPAGVFRHHIGFMGCCAAFPALRIAAAFTEADPDAVVLVVCAELCTLHVRASDDPDQIVANSVFGDGAAAVVVTQGGPGLRIERFATATVPEGASEMAWNIGDEGFEMILSTAVPKLVGVHVPAAVQGLLGEGETPSDVPVWAVHPGGRAIVDRAQESLGLPDAAVASSRNVLRDHGNMSSATVLFVLRDALEQGVPDGSSLVAVAFGPGLTVESARLTAVPA